MKYFKKLGTWLPFDLMDAFLKKVTPTDKSVIFKIFYQFNRLLTSKVHRKNIKWSKCSIYLSKDPSMELGECSRLGIRWDFHDRLSSGSFTTFWITPKSLTGCPLHTFGIQTLDSVSAGNILPPGQRRARDGIPARWSNKRVDSQRTNVFVKR